MASAADRMGDTMAPDPERTLSAARALVRALLDATSADQVTVPRSALSAVVAALPDDDARRSLPDPDLTVPDLAARYGRSASTIRQWLELGDFPGAYKLQGKEWRVPFATVRRFDQDGAPRRRPASPGGVPDLSAWRKAG